MPDRGAVRGKHGKDIESWNRVPAPRTDGDIGSAKSDDGFYLVDVCHRRGLVDRGVPPHLQGEAFLIRFADDAMMGFSSEQDTRRVLEAIPKRFSCYGLKLHPAKTRLVAFARPAREGPPRGPGRGQGPGTFELLGFTHCRGRFRRGSRVIQRKTAGRRLSRATRVLKDWCRRRHENARTQHQALDRILRGHYAYHGIYEAARAGNRPGLSDRLTQCIEKRGWKVLGEPVFARCDPPNARTA